MHLWSCVVALLVVGISANAAAAASPMVARKLPVAPLLGRAPILKSLQLVEVPTAFLAAPPPPPALAPAQLAAATEGYGSSGSVLPPFELGPRSLEVGGRGHILFIQSHDVGPSQATFRTHAGPQVPWQGDATCAAIYLVTSAPGKRFLLDYSVANAKDAWICVGGSSTAFTNVGSHILAVIETPASGFKGASLTATPLNGPYWYFYRVVVTPLN